MRKYLFVNSLVLALGLFLVIGAKCNFFMYADSALDPQVGHMINIMSKVGIACVAVGMFGFTGMIILGMRK